MVSSCRNNGTISQELRYPFTGTVVQFWQESSPILKILENPYMVFYGFSRIQGRHGWFTGYVKTGASLVGGALVLGAVILGVNVKGVNLPKLK